MSRDALTPLPPPRKKSRQARVRARREAIGLPFTYPKVWKRQRSTSRHDKCECGKRKLKAKLFCRRCSSAVPLEMRRLNKHYDPDFKLEAPTL